MSWPGARRRASWSSGRPTASSDRPMLAQVRDDQKMEERAMRLSDPRMQTWAHTLVTYCGSVKSGDKVAIASGGAAEPLLRALYHEVLVAGGLPVLAASFGGLTADLLTTGNDD